MPTLLTKIILSFSLIFITFISSATPVLAANQLAQAAPATPVTPAAQVAAPAPDPSTICDRTKYPQGCPLTSSLFNYLINGGATFGAFLHPIFCYTVGLSPLNNNQCFAYNVSGGRSTEVVYTGSVENGGLAQIGGLMATMYNNPPTSSTLYMADIGSNLGITPTKTYAQSVTGSGSSVILPVLEIWKVTRNLAYVAFIVVFVAIGFMIMFRQKISSSAVITVQAALPGLVIGLILVTFSYFIAALLIDIMFVMMQLAVGVFVSVAKSYTPEINNALGDEAGLKYLATNTNIYKLFWSSAANTNTIGTVYQGVYGQAWKTLDALNPLGHLTQNLNLGFLFPLILGGIGGAIFLPFGIISGLGAGAGIFGGGMVILPILVMVVLVIAMVIQAIKLSLMMITTYVYILVYTVTGPFYILMGSIPGNSGMISQWWRGILGNAMVFPAVFTAFLFAGAILSAPTTQSTATMPLFGGMDGNAIKALLAFGIILGTPSIPDMVRKSFKVSSPQGFGAAAMGAAAAGYGFASGKTKKALSDWDAPAKRIRDTRRKEEEEARFKGTPYAQSTVTPFGSEAIAPTAAQQAAAQAAGTVASPTYAPKAGRSVFERVRDWGRNRRI